MIAQADELLKIADDLKISYETERQHVNSKVSVKRQAALVVLINRIAH